MNYAEALKLKKGDLVVINNRITHYQGLVLEIEDIINGDCWCRRATLKQPGFNGGFHLDNYDTRYLQRFEP